MSRKNKGHTHKYHKIEMAGDKLWCCALPDCYHHMPKHYESMVMGKKSICWSCDQPMIMDASSMRDDMPICIDCKMGNNVSSVEVDKRLAELGINKHEL